MHHYHSCAVMFLEVLEAWGNTWLWEHMKVAGGVTWVHESIAQGTLIAVTDGSYIRELFPHICLAAFVLECSHRCGRIFRSFSESLRVANACRGELLGLMAIHLILLSVNKIHQNLGGSIKIVSDCLGALNRVTYLPPYHISSRCHHSDILKTSWSIAEIYPLQHTTCISGYIRTTMSLLISLIKKRSSTAFATTQQSSGL